MYMANVIIDEFIKDHIEEVDKPTDDILKFFVIIEVYRCWECNKYLRQRLNTYIKPKTIRQYFQEKYGDPSEGYTNIRLKNEDLYFEKK